MWKMTAKTCLKVLILFFFFQIIVISEILHKKILSDFVCCSTVKFVLWDYRVPGTPVY